VLHKNKLQESSKIKNIEYYKINLLNLTKSDVDTIVKNRKIKSILNLACTIGATGAFKNLEYEDLLSTINKNLKLVYNPIKFFGPHMDDNSVIINFSGAGVGSINPVKFQLSYFLSKLLTVGLVQYVSNEHVDIPHMVTVAPGKFESKFDFPFIQNQEIPLQHRNKMIKQNLIAKTRLETISNNLLMTIETIMQKPKMYCGTLISAQHDKIYFKDSYKEKYYLMRGQD
jgi:hypothetical protein